jgi:hypothetical protein
MVDNRGKFGAPRPLGFTPFAQSDAFGDRFISGGGTDVSVFDEEPADVAVIVTVRDGDVVGMKDELLNYMDEVGEFLDVQVEIEGDGSADIRRTGERIPIIVVQGYVSAGDPRVTMSQFEDGAERAVRQEGRPENVMAFKR